MVRGQRTNLARITPLLFFEENAGIFNDHKESGPQFNVSSEGQLSKHKTESKTE